MYGCEVVQMPISILIPHWQAIDLFVYFKKRKLNIKWYCKIVNALNKNIPRSPKDFNVGWSKSWYFQKYVWKIYFYYDFLKWSHIEEIPTIHWLNLKNILNDRSSIAKENVSNCVQKIAIYNASFSFEPRLYFFP